MCYNISPFKLNKESGQELKTDISSDVIEGSKRHFPSRYRVTVESIKRLIPNWELIFLDRSEMDEFVRGHFPDYFDFFNNLLYDEQRYNLMKYMFLYVNGGVAIDLNLQLLQSLDTLFSNIENVSLYTVFNATFHNYLSTSFIAAMPKCPIFTDILKEAKNPLPGWVYGRFLYTEVSTGSYLFTRLVKSSRIPCLMLSSELILPCNLCQKRCYNCDSYFKLLAKINPSYEEEVYRFLYCNWRELGLFFIILLVMYFMIKIFSSRQRKHTKKS